MSRSWTAEQKNAIEARGGTLLVSAAAGSGKTAVLVERIIARITDEQNPASADRLVVATFSNAAANEMRERLGSRMDALLEENPQNKNLRRQKVLLSKARISTIHSFCLSILRDNFQRLGIASDFTIGDENELNLMRKETAEEVAETFYAEQSPEFIELADMLSSGRDDNRLIDTILKLYGFICAHPFPNEWLDAMEAVYDPDIPTEKTIWGECLIENAAGALEHMKRAYGSMISAIEADDSVSKYYKTFVADKEIIDGLSAVCATKNWDDIYNSLNGVTFSSLSPIRGCESPLKTGAQELRKAFKKIVTDLRDKDFCVNSAGYREDAVDLKGKISALFAAVRMFAECYEEKKKAKSIVDFSDLEQLSLRLLWKTENGKHVKTDIACELAGEIDEIFIDEYQDTNKAQDMIFAAVSKNRENIFMVGDVKQSIYRFRQAMPEIFMGYKNSFARYDGKNFPAVINLDKNFRSRSGVTDGVNFVFSQLMSKQAGEMDYTADEYLNPMAPYPEAQMPEVQLYLIDLGEKPEEKRIVTEARQIARVIKQMIEGGLTVTDGGETRKADLGDFAVLLRSVKDKAEVYAKELAVCGIPAVSDAGGSLFDAREVSTVMSMLKVIDNPLSDMNAAAVMLSPMFGFTAQELAELRTQNRKQPLYLAAQNCEGEKAKQFVETVAELRTLAKQLTIAELIDSIYTKTMFNLCVRAMTRGKKRGANLAMLQSIAEGYEKNHDGGLSSFLSYAEKLAERGIKASEATAASENPDCVRIMSIHKSKGLEFPVCIVAGCSGQFNRQGLSEPSLIHPSLGFACRRRVKNTLAQFTTIPFEAVKTGLEASEMSEQMRLLYVAFTRAREYLVMISAEKSPDKKLSKLLMNIPKKGEKLSPYTVLHASSYSDWLLSCAMRRPEADNLRRLADADNSIVEDVTGKPWRINVVAPSGEELNEEIIETEAEPVNNELLKLFEKREKKYYDFIQCVEIPSKLAVSEIAQKASAPSLSSPKFLMKKGLTPTQRGNAVHKFMQFSNYENARKNAEAEIERLAQLGYISQEEADSIDSAKIEKFFSSPLAERMAGAKEVKRELKFVCAVTAEEYYNTESNILSGEEIILQGIADCVIIEEDGAVIVDYKTDRVKTYNELTERYAGQLYYYKRALEQGLEMPVKACALYSFALDGEVYL